MGRKTPSINNSILVSPPEPRIHPNSRSNNSKPIMSSAASVSSPYACFRFPTITRSIKSLVSIILPVCVILYILLYWYVNLTISVRTPVRHTRVDKESLTIVINTFRRHEDMADAVAYYSTCDVSKYIYVVWSENKTVPDHIQSPYIHSEHPTIRVIPHPTTSLNNRFLPLTDHPHTDAIFSVDDDMEVNCKDLENAYEVWKGNQQTIVGFMPRLHLRSRKDPNKLDYRCWWRVWFHGKYSIILTKAAIFHHKYLHQYSSVMPSAIRHLVDKERNCEDIAMQFLISNSSKLGPIYIRGSVRDKGTLNGISTSQNVFTAQHMGSRSDCLDLLVKAYGNANPLVESHIFVESVGNRWMHRPSTWFEYISSDLWKF